MPRRNGGFQATTAASRREWITSACPATPSSGPLRRITSTCCYDNILYLLLPARYRRCLWPVSILWLANSLCTLPWRPISRVRLPQLAALVQSIRSMTFCPHRARARACQVKPAMSSSSASFSSLYTHTHLILSLLPVIDRELSLAPSPIPSRNLRL
jgi:hypothetical protein